MNATNNELQGRVAIITGAAQGIGRGIAEKLGAHGAHLVLCDREAKTLEATVSELSSRNISVVSMARDIRDSQFADDICKLAYDTYGSIDIIVNNAGAIVGNFIENTSDAEWNLVFDVNVTAPFKLLRTFQHYAREFVQHEKDNNSTKMRHVINISSTAGVTGAPCMIAYSASKAALHNMTRTLAQEWAYLNINVNALVLSLVDTRATEPLDLYKYEIIDDVRFYHGMGTEVKTELELYLPKKRPATISEVADAAYLLCTNESRYVSGLCMNVTGGMPVDPY